MDVFDAIRGRRSVRRFLSKAVPRSDIEAIIDAARHAPTAHNAQPWEFVVVTAQELRDEIAARCPYGAFLSNAPVCIAVFCRGTDHSLEDGCAATQNILLAATGLGLGSCWVAGAGTGHAAEVARLLKARGIHHLVALIGLGYAAEESTLRPAKRMLGDVIHWENF
jgi:nitroreductase